MKSTPTIQTTDIPLSTFKNYHFNKTKTTITSTATNSNDLVPSLMNYHIYQKADSGKFIKKGITRIQTIKTKIKLNTSNKMKFKVVQLQLNSFSSTTDKPSQNSRSRPNALITHSSPKNLADYTPSRSHTVIPSPPDSSASSTTKFSSTSQQQ
ncbi:hypothetical protein ACTFIV_009586 [Dictyostelium citrinum]